MKSLLSEGITAGDIRIDSRAADILTRCVIGVQPIPGNILRELGTQQGLILERDTVLPGIAVRG